MLYLNPIDLGAIKNYKNLTLTNVVFECGIVFFFF